MFGVASVTSAIFVDIPLFLSLLVYWPNPYSRRFYSIVWTADSSRSLPPESIQGNEHLFQHSDAGLPDQPEGAQANRRDIRLVQGDWGAAADPQTRRGPRGLERAADPEQLQLGADGQTAGPSAPPADAGDRVSGVLDQREESQNGVAVLRCFSWANGQVDTASSLIPLASLVLDFSLRVSPQLRASSSPKRPLSINFQHRWTLMTLMNSGEVKMGRKRRRC